MPLKMVQNRDILISDVFQKNKQLSLCKGGHGAYMRGFGLVRGLYSTSERVYYFRGEQIAYPEGYMHACPKGYTAQQEDR